MADISYLQNEDLEDSDEAVEDENDDDVGGGLGDVGGGGIVGGGGGGDEGGGEQLSPLARLQQHAASETPFNRQMVGRILVEIFRAAVDGGVDLATEEIMIPVSQITDDPDASVRSELVEQVPHVAMICQEAPDRFQHVLPQHLLGIVIKYLRDTDNQVRKTAQAALLVLMERGLLEKEPIEHLVCPVVLELSYMNSPVEFHTGAIALMSKMAPLVGRELTERLFLDRFAELCSDNIFYVRKVCAANLGDFCAAVGREAVECILLPRFIDLCSDEIWGVRKACAEVIMSVSCCVSLHHRRYSMASVFADLLGDTSRWVRMSAFQTLGPFISTFAQQFTGLAYNQYGELVFTNQQGTELRYNIISYSNPSELSFSRTSIYKNRLHSEEDDDSQEGERQDAIYQYKSNPISMYYASSDVNKENLPVGDSTGQKTDEDRSNETSNVKIENNDPTDLATSDDVDKFNPFRYYYISPEMPLDLELVEAGRPPDDNDDAKRTNESAELDEQLDLLARTLLSCPIKDPPNLTGFMHTGRADGSDGTASSSMSLQNTSELLNDTIDICNVSDDKATPNTSINANSKYKMVDSSQTIVPPVLIDYFVSMTEPGPAVETDTEIPHHCAFSFPAVALTLGKKNWPLLKDAYQSLASAMQWKVRRTLASSIHEVAMILGEKLAARDLVPIYDGFIKDLDEVRIGALKHLATFLKVLRLPERRKYLPRLTDFLVTDNEWNWRFREELASQLFEAVTLFSPIDVAKHIVPLSLLLLEDKIAAVRNVALSLVTQITSHVSVNEAVVRALVQKLADLLVHSDEWMRRQTYALLCSQLISKGAITGERFAREMLPHLMNLSWDKVPNVRLVVARTLARNVVTMSSEWLGAEQFEEVEKKLRQMQQDTDRDVRELAIWVEAQ